MHLSAPEIFTLTYVHPVLQDQLSVTVGHELLSVQQSDSGELRQISVCVCDRGVEVLQRVCACKYNKTRF